MENVGYLAEKWFRFNPLEADFSAFLGLFSDGMVSALTINRV